MTKEREDGRVSPAMTSYLDHAGSFELLDVEEERCKARQLVELRRGWWRTLFRCADPRLVKSTARELVKEVPLALAKWTGAEVSDALVEAMMVADVDGRIPACLARSGDVPALKAAMRRYERSRNEFACSNLRLVVTVAKRIGRRHMPLSDRVQEGNIGLLKAIDRFDPERGCRFATYAAWWIRHAVTRALVKHGRTVRIPAHLHALFTKARCARTRLRNTLGRRPLLAEVATAVGAPVAKLKAATEAMELRSVGLDDPTLEDGGHTIGDVLADETMHGWADRLGERIDGNLADLIVDDLDELAFDIIVHRYGLRGAERRTLRSLGEDYDVSGERIRQLQNRALRGLREGIECSRVPSFAVV